EAELRQYEHLKDSTTNLDRSRRHEIRSQSSIVEDCANACLDDQILLLEHIGKVPWVTLDASVQNVLSIKFNGQDYLREKVQDAVEDLKALPAPTPVTRQAASAYVTPLSLPLERTNQQAQSPGTGDKGSVKRKAAPVLLSDVFGSRPVNSKKPRLDGSDDEYAPIDDDDDDDEPEVLVDDVVVAAAADESVAQAINDQGFIRVGPQPLKVQLFVQSAPVQKAKYMIKRAVERNQKKTDHNLLGADTGHLQLAAAQMTKDLESLAIESEPGWVTLLCDYTGLPISWAPGPRSPSVESIYPVVKFEGHYAYHAPPNVCLIMSFINWAKRQHTPIALPLVSVWLNAREEENFDSRRRQCAWAFNALSNVVTITRSWRTMGYHKSKFERWGSLELSQQRAILEVQRTGERIQEMHDIIQATDVDFLWAAVYGVAPAKLGYRASSIYRNLERIAESKGITASEFEYYCTLPSPGRRRQRVFYPFHVLSRPQAESMKWDWPILHQLCQEMLRTMRTWCNKHAEKAGYGEAHVDEVRLIYWMGHWVCDQINTLKAQLSDREEIAFSLMVDRWGLPIVPWVSHILRVSLCKKQDHGIAMVFGIEDAPDFDPIQHIDLSRTTVTIDTSLTNMAMRNYDDGSWDSLRSTLMQVPLHHPFWKVNLSLGNEVWAGEWDRSVEPLAPTPEFQANLLSIEAWLDEQTREPFSCAYCAQIFNSAGQLVEHSRKCSQGIQDEHEAPNLDPADEDYWHFRCDECGQTFSNLDSLVLHRKIHLGIKSHKCSECGSAFLRADNLKDHMRMHTNERSYKCDQCSAAFRTLGSLKAHKRTHTGEKPHGCNICGARFTQSGQLVIHMRKHTGARPYKCDKCPATFATSTALAYHKTTHTGEKPYKCDFKGCDKAFTAASTLNVHMRTHTGEKPHKCDFENCDKAFSTKSELTVHTRIHTGEKPYKCDFEDCGKAFSTKSHLTSHKRVHTSERPFKCDECDAIFSHRGGLNTHKRRRHPK
ncbi:hypothetical protein ACHAO7_006290, partial [Fusarium culmorum]